MAKENVSETTTEEAVTTEEVVTDAAAEQAAENPYSFLDEIVQVEEKTPEAYKGALLAKLQEVAPVEAAKPTSFANDVVAQYNSFVSVTGNTDFTLFQRVINVDNEKFKEASFEEKIGLITQAEVESNPFYKGKESLLSTKFSKDFSFPSEEDMEMLSEDEKMEVELKKLEFDTKLNKAVSYFSGLKEKVISHVPAPPSPEFDEAKLEAVKGEVVKTLENYQLLIPKVEIVDEKAKISETETQAINFDVETKKFFDESVMLYLSAMKPSDVEQGKLEALEYAKVVTLATNYAKDVALAEKRGYEKAIREIENPSPERIITEQVAKSNQAKPIPFNNY